MICSRYARSTAAAVSLVSTCIARSVMSIIIIFYIENKRRKMIVFDNDDIVDCALPRRWAFVRKRNATGIKLSSSNHIYIYILNLLRTSSHMISHIYVMSVIAYLGVHCGWCAVWTAIRLQGIIPKRSGVASWIIRFRSKSQISRVLMHNNNVLNFSIVIDNLLSIIYHYTTSTIRDPRANAHLSIWEKSLYMYMYFRYSSLFNLRSFRTYSTSTHFHRSLWLFRIDYEL